jgi:hypothetical protein
VVVVGAMLVVLLAFSRAADAQTDGGPGILFLHLKVTNQVVSLVEANIRPGVLKPGPEGDSAALHCELVSDAGKSLWKGSVADPTVRHLEYEDPAHPGKLQHRVVQVDAAEFTLRVPVLPEARRVDFYKVRPDSGKDGGGQKAARASWGSISLPVKQPPAR